MPTYRLTPNVAIRATVKYADVVESEYGPEIRFSGTIEGEDGKQYFYAKLTDAIEQLVALGALDGVPRIPAELPGGKFALRLKVKEFIVTKVQHAGDKHGRVTFARADGGSPTQALAAPNGPAPRGASPAAEPLYRDEPAPTAREQRAADRPRLTAVYGECLSYVLERCVPRLVEARVDVTHEGVGAMTAALFIQRCREER